MSRHLGLDLGGTNIKWTVLAREGGAWQVVDKGQVPTPADEGEDAVVTRLVSVGEAALQRWPEIATVGIGVPGTYDPASGATRFLTNIPGAWEGKPVAALVAEALGVPCFLINDARAFGLAELRLGAGRGAASMVGITLGTGVGGVIALDGRVYQGHDGTAGELGHQTVEMDGPDCTCGGKGCLEVFVRADAIRAASGADSVEEAVERARAGDAQATAAITDAARYLGIGIANVVSVFTPDRVVLGGGVSAAFDLLVGPIRAELRRRVHLTSLDAVVIVPAQLGVWAGAIGAALHGVESESTT
jgi:glucokinase